jgi:integrase
MFVFQCLIGCRVGDFTKLKRSNIIDGCIEYIAGKTKDNKPRVARVPLTKKAIEIISRYNFENGDLFPYIEPQKYNKNLKELFRFTKITRQVTILDPKTRENKQVSIADIASSHMARRVLIGNLMNLPDVKNEVIASMSGHVHNSKAFSRYYNVEKKSQIDAMKHIE